MFRVKRSRSEEEPERPMNPPTLSSVLPRIEHLERELSAFQCQCEDLRQYITSRPWERKV